MQIPTEHNLITNEWRRHNVFDENALDSQALIELKNNYCDHKLCLKCAVGNRLLKNS